MMWALVLGLKQCHKENDITPKNQPEKYAFLCVSKQLILNGDNEGK